MRRRRSPRTRKIRWYVVKCPEVEGVVEVVMEVVVMEVVVMEVVVMEVVVMGVVVMEVVEEQSLFSRRSGARLPPSCHAVLD